MSSSKKMTVIVPVPKRICNIITTVFGNTTKGVKALSIIKEMIFQHQKCFAPMLHYLPYDYKTKKKLLGGSEFYPIWNELEKLEILEPKVLPGNRAYSYSGHICKSYRISPKWLDGDVMYLEHARNLNDFKVDDENMCRLIENTLKYVNVSTSDGQINNKSDSLSQDYIDNKFKITMKGIKYKYAKISYKESLSSEYIKPYLSFEKINISESYKGGLKLLNLKHFYISKSTTNGRINYNLTNLPSELLKLLDLDNNCLCEIDLSCSQPLILSYLIKSIINNNMEPISADRFLNQSIKKHLSPPLLFSSNIPPSDNTSKSDIEVFMEKTEEGQLYEYFSTQLFGSCNETTRKEAKLSFISSLYSKSESRNVGKLKFAKVFPKLTKLLDSVKIDMIETFEDHLKNGSFPELNKYTFSNRKGNKDAKSAGNDFLAVKLQEIESTIFLDHILPDLYRSGLMVLPKHDAILCRQEDLSIVMEIVTTHLDRIFGAGNYKSRTKVLNEVPNSCSNLSSATIKNERTKESSDMDSQEKNLLKQFS
ncbi:MAG TPA: hypothetical protein PKM27_03360 [Saprospiraceae bacterium]|nr:hypothetical protein [Saprospiraceae bacterium]HNT20555.1 hypothetical protein [Saprospiraceae bacterium]